jgi:hypothetical protein
VTDLIENIGLDLVLRTTMFGLALVPVALFASFANRSSTWCLCPDPAVAVFAP